MTRAEITAQTKETPAVKIYAFSGKKIEIYFFKIQFLLTSLLNDKLSNCGKVLVL